LLGGDVTRVVHALSRWDPKTASPRSLFRLGTVGTVGGDSARNLLASALK